jgi:hypothetical protein
VPAACIGDQRGGHRCDGTVYVGPTYSWQFGSPGN